MAKVSCKKTISKKVNLEGILNAEASDVMIIENAVEGNQPLTELLAEFDSLAVKITIEAVEETPLPPMEE